MSVGKTTLVNALKELPEFKDYKFATERSEYLRDLGNSFNALTNVVLPTLIVPQNPIFIFLF
jgi:GTPase SAR1 family protein